ncbi:sulfite exporter TauE/SafE family protein [Aeromicrobium sp.]|uniref:sulfite exporter TauE/SafE family protein n=1 Tax=Aeromicrobium sp. TaxID=1871063 RepID=UPI0019C58C96|nr:sulfite exporter TauE/SafE family protein [Aeromicrobium sp.]MBC7633552.1 sulfite exporter TauE/SafE family protein [Aeromicrobium sp.]
MGPLEQLAVVAAGLGAGFVMSAIGVASLVSFPVLIALGLPPVVANTSNTVGLIPAGLSGSFGYRRELSTHPRLTIAVLLTGAAGSIAGAFLLLRLPAGVFDALVPWLILFACTLVGLQPRISAWLRIKREGHELGSSRTRMTRGIATLTTFAGVYGGYFGAGQGVVVVAILALGLDLELKVVNALKTLAVLSANVVAGVIFIAIADLDWAVVGLLGAGSVIGGYVGSRVGRVLPPGLFRSLVVTAGVTAAAVMLFSR